MTKKEKENIREYMTLTKFVMEEAQAARKVAARKNDNEDYGYRTGLIQGYIEAINFCASLLDGDKK